MAMTNATDVEEVDVVQLGADRTPASHRARRLGRRILVGLLSAYLLYFGFLYFFQDWLVFPASLAPQSSAQPPVAGAVTLTIEIPNDASTYAWFMPAPNASDTNPLPAVVFFHGNAEVIDQWVNLATGYHQLGCSVLLPEYRGYGQAGGSPSRPAVRDDMLRFYDILAARPDVDADRIVLHGRSLGGAIATELAEQRPPVALILQSTFTNMSAMAHRYLAPGFLSRHRYHTDHIIAGLNIPTLIFHGSRDKLAPVEMGRTLNHLAANCTYVEYDCGHNDLPGPANVDDYWQHIEELLRQTNILHESR